MNHTHERLVALQPIRELKRKAVKARRKGRRDGRNGYDLATQEDRDLNFARYHTTEPHVLPPDGLNQ